MSVFIEFFKNRVLFAAVLGWLLSQVAKLLFTLIITHKWKLERLWGAGGMPSAHSSMASAMTIAMARFYGVNNPLFALTVMFSFVTMYDAMGVRREAGVHARLLNKYLNNLEKNKADKDDDGMADNEEEEIELKEFIGHTPVEVLGGVLLGILIGVLIPA